MTTRGTKGSGKRLTPIIDLIYKYWQRKDDPEYNGKLNLVLDSLNAEIKKRGLRENGLAMSTLYKEFKKLSEKKKEIEFKKPFLDQTFNLGTLIREYGNQVDAEAIEQIFLTMRYVTRSKDFCLAIFSNRLVLWISRLHRIIKSIIPNNEGEEKGREDLYFAMLLNISMVYGFEEMRCDYTEQPFNTHVSDGYLMAAVLDINKWTDLMENFTGMIKEGETR